MSGAPFPQKKGEEAPDPVAIAKKLLEEPVSGQSAASGKDFLDRLLTGLQKAYETVPLERSIAGHETQFRLERTAEAVQMIAEFADREALKKEAASGHIDILPIWQALEEGREAFTKLSQFFFKKTVRLSPEAKAEAYDQISHIGAQLDLLQQGLTQLLKDILRARALEQEQKGRAR